MAKKKSKLKNKLKSKLLKHIKKILFLISIILICLYFIRGENIWKFLRNVVLGIFGFGFIFVPIIMLCFVFSDNPFNPNSKKEKLLFKKIDIFLISFLPILFNIFLCLITNNNISFSFSFLKNIFLENCSNGGVICAIISCICVFFMGQFTFRKIVIMLILLDITFLIFLHKVNLKLNFKSIKNFFNFVKRSKKNVLNTFEEQSLEQNELGDMLISTLKSFGINAKILNISQGPSVTRYEIQPSPGVKLSKITSLADNIALSLSALGVRIEAPIPGKSAVGIEIPKKNISTVNIKELFDSSVFKNTTHNLPVVLGKDITGECIVADLSKMPHLLIAGSTGSGKSVCVNSFIASIIHKLSPENVRFLMIDPKVVELSVYNGIPHLLIPVVTDPKKASGALFWAVEEMLFRYKIFAKASVRDLESYNNFVKKNSSFLKENENLPKKMARMLIIIDELADLMMASPKEIEDYICRLAQMARAAGMHLIIATQRPSVDVITGIIKANIPSRIALAVSSQVDSRTILDTSGAEKLIGRGDMLFYPLGSVKPIRVQGCYIADEDIQKIVSDSKSKQEVIYDEKIIEKINEATMGQEFKNTNIVNKNPDDPDPKFDEAVKHVIESGIASISFINKTIGIGYKRSGKLIDDMEKFGIIGPYEGSKPRKVMITYKQFLDMKKTRSNIAK